MRLFIEGDAQFVREIGEHVVALRLPQVSIAEDDAHADCRIRPFLPSASAGEAEEKTPVVLVVSPDDIAAIPDSADDLLVVRGPGERQHLGFALKLLGRQRDLSEVHRLIRGPFEHDISGALSVLTLSVSLLESAPESTPLAKKLRRSARKVEAAVETLRARSALMTDAMPDPAPLLTPEGLAAYASEWTSYIHPDRSLQVEPLSTDSPPLPLATVRTVLQGLIDGVARLTEGDITVRSGASRGVLWTAHGSLTAMNEGQRSALVGGSATWRWADPEIVPYRLATAGLALELVGGSLDCIIKEPGLELVARLEVRD